MRVPALARALRTVANGVIAVKSCNQGFWREDLETVNGFDEAMIGWGSEDKELCARLENTGIRRQTLVFAALAWHLSHAPAPRQAAAANRARWAETVRTGRTALRGWVGRAFDHLTIAIFPSGAPDSTLL